MGNPITIQPGTPQGYQQPLDAMMAAFGGTPMGDADLGHRYQHPLAGLPGQLGAFGQMVPPAFLQSMMPAGMMLGQFDPSQQLYDQFKAKEFFEGSQTAAAIASKQDVRAIDKMLGGMTQVFTGQPLDEVQTARNFNLAQGMTKMMPMLSMALGPDLIDQLHGSRGSATVMSQQIHQAMRTAMDPITGRVGYSGESAGQVTSEVYDQLFGEGADVSAMKGMSAGQVGMTMHDLQARGLLGRSIATLPFNEQRSMVPEQLSESTINRLASTLKPVREVIAAGGVPSEELLETARKSIRTTHSKLKDSTQDITQADLDDMENMPGGQEIIRAADADRIVGKLKNLSGAVKAMRDIFGDMGNPNAPMREIINGLDALTQGGLATMSPGAMEAMVRKTHNLAKQTGMGVQGIMALTSQNANLADQLGIDRGYAVSAAQQSAAFGAATGDVLSLDKPTFGAASKEELVLADSQLRMQAAAAPLTNQVAALLRMSDSGMAKPAEGTELAALIKSTREGNLTYEFDGETRDVVMHRSVLQDMLERDAGITQSQSWSILSDRFGNQEFGQQYNLEDFSRRAQTNEAAQRQLAPMLSRTFRGAVEDAGVAELLKSEGIAADDQDVRRMTDEMGSRAGTDFFDKMTSDEIRTPELRRKRLGTIFRDRFRQSIAGRMEGSTEEEIDQATQKMVDKMGGDAGMQQMGEAMFASANTAFSKNSVLKNAVRAYDILNQDVMKQGKVRERQAEADGLMQSALAGIGTAGPIRRIVDALQVGGPETSFQELMGKALGGVSLDSIAAADPEGIVARTMGLSRETQKLDPNDPEQMKELRRNAAMIKGLVQGGDTAKEQLEIMDQSRTVDGQLTIGNQKLYDSMEASSQGKSFAAYMDDHGYLNRAQLSKEQLGSVTQQGARAEKLLQGEATKESKKVTEDFVVGAHARAKQLINDDVSMEQLGQGGLSLVRTTMDHSRTLQSMVQEQSEKLGREVTLEDLIRGKDVDTEVHSAAMKEYEGLQSGWKEINARRSFDLLPGKGTDEANKARQKMTPREKAELESQQEFEAKYSTEEERATAVMDRMITLLPEEQRDQLDVDTNRAQVIEAISSGNRAGLLNQAFDSREGIVHMALSKGVFGEKTKAEELTTEERRSAVTKLEALDLDENETADLARMKQQASPVMDFGLKQVAVEEGVDEALKTVNGIRSATMMTPIADQQKQEMKIKGDLTIKDGGETRKGTLTGESIFGLLGLV
jgi:hypothetical protein